ncbi:MAG TPA: ABC transporter permease [Chloroflexia bacterium]|nr:ABC transporter permease [Chloroflexia bacterium]
MRRFIIRRLLQSLLLVWAIMSLTFLLVAIAPGGPDAVLAQNPKLTREQVEAVREKYGLNKPIYEQYIVWMGRIVTFDFGKSYTDPHSASELVAARIPPTAQLGLFSYLIGMLGIPIGIYAARHRGKLGDNVIRVLTVIGSCMPVWWISLMVIIILANTVKWFPQGEGLGGIGPWFLHLMIPAALLSTGTLISFTRFVRSETLEVLSQDYVRTANAKGLPANQVNRWHVFRNSLIPVVTLLGYLLPTLVSGAIITETIFNWPGMGRLFFQAATSRDMPVLLCILYISTILTVIGTLLADIGYGVVDPRVRYD